MAIQTVAQVIRTYGTSQPDVVAFHHDGGALTYGALHERSNRVARGLIAEGVGPQQHVCWLDKNSTEFFDLWFGCGKANAVMTPVNWRLAPREVAYIVNNAEARVFVVGQEFVPVLDAIEGELTTVAKILVVGDHPRHERFEDWVARQADDDTGIDGGPDDVAVQMYSSGTTGLPKGVMLANRNLFASMPMYEELMEFGPDSVNLVAMPLFHIGGGGWAMAGLAAGIPGVLLREVDPVKILDVIEQYRVSHAFLVPAVLQFMLMVPGVEQRDFSSLKYVLYGASPISTEVLARSIRTFGCKFMQAYGLTETTGTVVLLMPEDHDPDGPNAHRLRAAGKAIPNAEIKVVDPATGAEVPVGEVGEIWIRSPQVMLGYWNNPDETAKAIQPDGFFRSGDAGYLDADGYVYIHDRVKDMIVSGGENIYPAEVENVLMAHPAVADVAVIGVPHEKWGETPKAMVVKAAGAEVTEQELIDFCRERLARYKCPTSVDFIDAIPRNPSGKVLKKDLRAPFWEGRDRFVS